MFEILNVSAFQICLCLFCADILSKVINNFAEIFPRGFEVFVNRKMLILSLVVDDFRGSAQSVIPKFILVWIFVLVIVVV